MVKKTRKNKSKIHIGSGKIYEKKNVDQKEYFIHKMAYDNNIPTPKPISIDNDGTMKMDLVNGMSVADWYGDTSEGLKRIKDEGIMEEIRKIISSLKDLGIIYPDITGYNFIIDIDDDKKVYVIDFGDAFLIKKITRNIDFVDNFISGKSLIWNPDFK